MKTPSGTLIRLGWLYPDLMSTYGDRGNVMIFVNRAAARGIHTEVIRIDTTTDERTVMACDAIFGGGAQDRQQAIVIPDLRDRKGPMLRDLFADGVAGLFVCGSPQLLGHSYMTGDGETLKGLGIFDMESRHFGHDRPRCIGDTAARIPGTYRVGECRFSDTIVGFENHGGRTYLGSGVKPFGTVLSGNGNNGEDGTEGAVYNNCIATYYHGPFLSKNPHIADWILSTVLLRKTGKKQAVSPLGDTYEWRAHDAMLERMGITGVTA